MVVVREPVQACLAEFNRQLAGQTGHAGSLAAWPAFFTAKVANIIILDCGL